MKPRRGRPPRADKAATERIEIRVTRLPGVWFWHVCYGSRELRYLHRSVMRAWMWHGVVEFCPIVGVSHVTETIHL